MAQAAARKAKAKESWGESVKTLVYALLIAVGIRTVLFEPFSIPSGSMIPTLLVNDYLFVSKYSYGYSRFSFPFSFPPFSGRVFGSTPARGDIAVFRKPTDTSEDYIKRIVGLPGDHIQMRAGVLYVNGTEAVRGPSTGDCSAEERGTAQRFTEALPASTGDTPVLHAICKLTDSGWWNNTTDYVVPAGDLFAMGDNRDNSQDSRYQTEVGFVPIENLVGRAEFIFFSVSDKHPWWQAWHWPLDIRWSRLFDSLR